VGGKFDRIKRGANVLKIFFYGWIIFISTFLFSLMTGGFANATVSLYVSPVVKELGFSRGQFTLSQSFFALASMVAAFSIGAIIKRIGLRNVLLLGTILTTAALFINSIASQLILFYIAAVLFGFGIIFTTVIPLSNLINNWFVERRSTLIGVIMAATGLGGMVFNPLVQMFISTYGWRASYRLTAIFVGFICLIAWFVVRNNPSDIGLVALGAKKSENTAKTEHVKDGLTQSEAIKSLSFWLVCIAAFLMGFGVQPVIVNIAAHFKDVGIDMTVVATIVGSLYLVAALSKLSFGAITDKFGVRPIIIIPSLAFCAGVVALIFARTPVVAAVSAFFIGIAFVIMTIVLPFVTAAAFGTKDYANIFGKFMTLFSLGMVVGIILIGVLFDHFGSYTYAFIAEAVGVLIAMVLNLSAVSLRKKQS